MSDSDPQRWQRVKEIFHGALERKGVERDAFLDEECGDESSLRAEVDSLLRSYEVAGSFMESPAVAQAADSLAGPEHKLTAGQRVKHYQIVNLLGEGGMGEVYLATDTILGRRVALKVLPAFVRNDADRLRRFTQEARAASRLSHPNVCMVHEIGETDDGRPFIAMEYVEGVTLRHRLKNQALKLGDVLDIAIQIAEALIAAHETGIVHRDIKPENVMIRPEGYVKILDFGLAKLTERHKGALQTTMSTLLFHSTPGTVIGTAAYMSPEQARGVPVDERTDIWGLGVVLYEMASGNPPFTGETPTDVVVSIVERDQPPISQYVEGAPPELERIVKKALRKDRNERYQIVKELAIDLRSLRRELEINSLLERSVAPGMTASLGEGVRASTGREKVDTNELRTARTIIQEPARRSSRAWLAVAAAIAVAVIGFGIYKLRPRSATTARVPFERLDVAKLTTTGNATLAGMSPDGKYVVYVTSEGGKSSLWLRQVAINTNAQLIAPREGRYLGVAFSPDENFIYFAYAGSDRNDAGQIYRLPVLGIGAVPIRIQSDDALPSLSHDKKRLAFIRFDHANYKHYLVVANADGSGQQIVATRSLPDMLALDGLTRPQWTAGDKSLLVPVTTSDASSNNGIGASYFISIFEKDLVSGAEKTIPLTSQKFDEVGRLNLLPDGSGMLMLAKAYGDSFIHVWQIFRDGSTRTVTNDLSDYKELSLSADGTSFVTVQTQTLAKIWTLRKGDSKPAAITPGASRFFDLYVTPDDKIVYASDATGVADIFEIAAGGGETRQLTSEGRRNYAPAVSPDNRYLAFHSNRAGVFQIWRTERDGSSPKQLTFGSSESTWPSFSPDGKWIVYQHYEQGTPFSLWRIPVDDGTPEKITDGVAIRATISPDGKMIAFWYNDQQGNSTWKLKVIQFEGGATVNVFDVPPTAQVNWDSPLHWTPDGRNLTYVDHRGGFDNIWGQPIEGGAPKQMTNFEDSLILSFDWKKDGSLVASRGVIMSDVVLISDATK